MAPAGARGFTARFDSAGRTEKWMIIFSRFTMSPLRKLRSLVGGQEHMEHIEHVFSYIIPGLAPRGSFGTCPFPQPFSQKYVFHVFCVFSQRKFANVVCSACVPMCSPEKWLASSRPLFAPLAPPVGQTEHRSSPYDMSDRCRTTKTCTRIEPTA